MEKEDQTAKKSGPSPWFILGILSTTLLAVMFSETMLLPAIPEIMQDFGVPYSLSAWVFSAYLIVAAVMTPIAGKLSDVYGSKKILLILLTIYVGGIVAGGFSTNIYSLLASRVVQGVGFAAVPVAFSILRNSFPLQKLPLPVAVFSSAASGGSVVGLLVGASIIQNFGWQATFFFIAPVAASIGLAIARFVPTSPPSLSRHGRGAGIDIKGAIALSATITSFLIALTYIENGALSEDSIVIVAASFAVSAISLAGFVFVEKRVQEPLINLKLLRHKVLLPSYLMMVVIGTTMFLVYPSIVQFVRSPPPSGFGGDAIDAANVQLPFMIIFLIFSSISALVIARLGKVNPTIFGGIISIIGAIGLLMFHSTTMLVAVNLTVIAVGLAMTATATWNLVVSSAPMEFMGISTGIGALLLSIGMSVGPALAGTYMQDHITIEGMQFPSPTSFDMIFLTTGLLAAAWLFFALLLKRRLPRSEEQVSHQG